MQACAALGRYQAENGECFKVADSDGACRDWNLDRVRVLQGWKATMCSPRPASGRQGMLLPVEDNKWQLILTGLKDDHPPTDEEGYLEFARSLPSPEIYDALKQAEPLGPIHVFNRTENVKRLYGQVGRQPLCKPIFTALLVGSGISLAG